MSKIAFLDSINLKLRNSIVVPTILSRMSLSATSGLAPDQIGAGVLLHGWYHTSGIVLDVAQSSLASWTDGGPNGNDLTATATGSGVFVASGQAGPTGHDAVWFPSGSEMFGSYSADFDGTDTPHTVFIVCQPHAQTGNLGTLWSVGNTASDNASTALSLSADSGIIRCNRRDDALNAAIASGSSPGLAMDGIDSGIITVWYDGTTIRAYFNGISGVLEDNNNLGNLTLNVYQIGDLRRTSRINFYTGKMWEVVVYTSGLNESNRRDVEDYLSTRFSIPLGR
jgi:hypothetical protein